MERTYFVGFCFLTKKVVENSCSKQSRSEKYIVVFVLYLISARKKNYYTVLKIKDKKFTQYEKSDLFCYTEYL